MRGEVGNDGLWKSDDKFTLLVEVKTTDAYRINLDTVAGYRDELVRSGQLDSKQSSILIAVGRQDTGDLEAQIRGSRHAWDVRLISLEALLHLAEVKEQLSDWDTSNKINQLLRPVEYTRLDGIVELLFAAKEDLATPESIAPPIEAEASKAAASVTPNELENAREKAIQNVAKKFNCTFVRRGRAARISSDGASRLVCIASQRYVGPAGAGNYWFGFTPAQRVFLSGADNSWVALVCVDSGRCFLVPWEQFNNWLPDFWTTPTDPPNIDDIRHWHVYFNDFGSRVELMKAGGGVLLDLVQYLVPQNVE